MFFGDTFRFEPNHPAMLRLLTISVLRPAMIGTAAAIDHQKTFTGVSSLCLAARKRELAGGI
jgi:hypothetical protein